METIADVPDKSEEIVGSKRSFVLTPLSSTKPTSLGNT